MDSDSFVTATGVLARDVRLRLLKSRRTHSARSQMPEKGEPDDLSRMKPRRQRCRGAPGDQLDTGKLGRSTSSMRRTATWNEEREKSNKMLGLTLLGIGWRFAGAVHNLNRLAPSSLLANRMSWVQQSKLDKLGGYEGVLDVFLVARIY